VSLKKLVLALLIVNLGYFCYSQGWLQLLTGGDSAQREPDRMAKQINAEVIQVKPVPTIATIPVAPQAISRPAEACTVQREQWLIYMGPYLTTALNERKKAELKQLGVTSTEVSKPNLKIGLSLGQFATEALAKDALKRLGSKGVKTATIVLWATVDAPC
jgi:cell division protein FtsN